MGSTSNAIYVSADRWIIQSYNAWIMVSLGWFGFDECSLSTASTQRAAEANPDGAENEKLPLVFVEGILVTTQTPCMLMCLASLLSLHYSYITSAIGTSAGMLPSHLKRPLMLHIISLYFQILSSPSAKLSVHCLTAIFEASGNSAKIERTRHFILCWIY